MSGPQISDPQISARKCRSANVGSANVCSDLSARRQNSLIGAKLDQLYNFSKNAGWSLIFDLNLMLRSGDKWDPSNSQDFINYTSSKGYEMNFELGNGN